MEHLAYLRKSRHLLEKILSGEKTIESRWYVSRFTPYNRIKSEDIVYFKESGSPVTASARVEKVIQYSGLTHDRVSDILQKYGSKIGLPESSWSSWAQEMGPKNYAVLIFLKEARKITPFQIDKRGFGNMAAWITVDKVETLKKS